MLDFYALTEQGRARRLRKVVSAALENYPLDFARLRLITNSQNGVFRLDARDGKKYVMRVCLPQSQAREGIQLETAWLEALQRDTDLLLPSPIPTHSGELYCQVSAPGVPEARYCVLFSWVPGRTLDEGLNLENMQRFGALAARLHQHAVTFQPPAELKIRYRYDRIFPFDEPVLLFEPGFTHLLPPPRLEIFRYAFDRVRQAIERLKASGEPMRLLHGDLHRWNVKVFRRRLGVLDFEDMMLGWPVQDIGTTLLYFYGDEDYLSNREAFQDGYLSVTPWPETVEGEVDTFIAGRNLVLANTVLQESIPEWKEMTPRYFARVERRLRALLLGEGEFIRAGW